MNKEAQAKGGPSFVPASATSAPAPSYANEEIDIDDVDEEEPMNIGQRSVPSAVFGSLTA